MNHLQRNLAPVSEAGWKAVDEEAARTLRTALAARRLVDFHGPLGWDRSAVDVGRVERVNGPGDGVVAGVRVSQPLVELRTPFTLARADLDDAERGRPDPDLAAVVDAAQRAAWAEDRLVFAGFKEAGVIGVAEASPHPPLPITDDAAEVPRAVARAVSALRTAGVDGPYGAALGPRCWSGVIETTEYGGYPVLEHLGLILGGPVVWAPAVEGAVVLSLRGGDFTLSCGADLAVGYLAHGPVSVDLYLEESVAFRVLTAEAAVPLTYG